MTKEPPGIWTVGHSTRTFAEFLELLQSCGIEFVADVRQFPSSRRFPHFNKTALSEALSLAGIGYEHFLGLGGRRPVLPDSHNLGWKNAAFRGYADYMETRPFEEGIERLTDLARRGRTALMCAEALWWRCHRSLIADYLKWKGATVFHITGPGRCEEHPYTSVAAIVDGRLSYKAAGPAAQKVAR
jgi:uncharacterized protein (DUF488 family)